MSNEQSPARGGNAGRLLGGHGVRLGMRL